MTADKFARIGALRPVAPRAAVIADAGGQRKLMHLLEAECRRNELGEHLLVRRWAPQPQPPAVAPRAFSLLTPHKGEGCADPGQWLFLDTETTGLAGGTGTYAFLVGIAWWEAGGLAIEQFFMRNHAEEASLLLALKQRLAERRVLVTFNGKSFDWPLLQTRYRMVRTPAFPEEPAVHLDLMHAARQLWRLRVQSAALNQLERHVLALDRGADIPSGTIPARYFEFLRGGASEPIAEVFRHNEMDLRGLAALARKIVEMLEDPEAGAHDGGELYGISKILQRRGQAQGAVRSFERALACGLPPQESRKAQRELARMARRGGDYDRANRLWEGLLGGGPEGLEAYEQLAIHYEHRSRQPLRALALTREALVKLTDDFRSGNLAPVAYRQWHARFRARLSRLSKAEARSRKPAEEKTRDATDYTDFSKFF